MGGVERSGIAILQEQTEELRERRERERSRRGGRRREEKKGGEIKEVELLKRKK